MIEFTVDSKVIDEDHWKQKYELIQVMRDLYSYMYILLQ